MLALEREAALKNGVILAHRVAVSVDWGTSAIVHCFILSYQGLDHILMYNFICKQWGVVKVRAFYCDYLKD